MKEFGPLHGTLSLLVRNTDISMFESETGDESSEVAAENPYRIPGSRNDLRPPPESMHQALFSIEHSKRLIREVHVCVHVCTLCVNFSVRSAFVHIHELTGSKCCSLLDCLPPFSPSLFRTHSLFLPPSLPPSLLPFLPLLSPPSLPPSLPPPSLLSPVCTNTARV